MRTWAVRSTSYAANKEARGTGAGSGQHARTRLSSSMRAAEVMSVDGRTTSGASVITSPTLRACRQPVGSAVFDCTPQDAQPHHTTRAMQSATSVRQQHLVLTSCRHS